MSGAPKYISTPLLTARLDTKKLNSIIDKIAFYRLNTKKKVDNVLAAGALLIESSAKELSPVDTGLNRSSIHAVRESYLKWRVGVNTEYAVHLEFGTVKMPAQPFLFPAYLLHRDDIIAAVKVAMKYK